MNLISPKNVSVSPKLLKFNLIDVIFVSEVMSSDSQPCNKNGIYFCISGDL